MTQEMAATEVLSDAAIWGRPTLTRLVSMVAMNAPSATVIRSLFLLIPILAVLRVVSYKGRWALRILEDK
jgi:hypothetical protein